MVVLFLLPYYVHISNYYYVCSLLVVPLAFVAIGCIHNYRNLANKHACREFKPFPFLSVLQISLKYACQLVKRGLKLVI